MYSDVHREILIILVVVTIFMAIVYLQNVPERSAFRWLHDFPLYLALLLACYFAVLSKFRKCALARVNFLR